MIRSDDAMAKDSTRTAFADDESGGGACAGVAESSFDGADSATEGSVGDTAAGAVADGRAAGLVTDESAPGCGCAAETTASGWAMAEGASESWSPRVMAAVAAERQAIQRRSLTIDESPFLWVAMAVVAAFDGDGDTTWAPYASLACNDTKKKAGGWIRKVLCIQAISQ